MRIAERLVVGAVLIAGCSGDPVGNQPEEFFRPDGIVAARRVIAGDPYGLAISKSGVVYAALIGSTELIRGSLTTMEFTDRVTAGDTPPHVAFNASGTRVYATLQTGRQLVAVDAGTNQVIGSAPLASDGFNLLVGPNDLHVYVTTADGLLYIFDATSLAEVKTLPVGAAANGLVLSPDGQRLYVTSRDLGTVTAVATGTNTIAKTYQVGGALQRIAISPDGRELYAADEGGRLAVVNVASGAVTSIAQPPGSVPYGIAVTRDGAEIWVGLALGGTIRVLDRSTKALVKEIAVGGVVRNIAFSHSGKDALVTNQVEVVFIR